MCSNENDNKICRICLSNTLNLFDDDLVQKIINRAEAEKNSNEENEEKKEILNNNDNNNKECCRNDEMNGKDNEYDNNISERLKGIDSLVIKKCIYDYYYENNKDDILCMIENFYNSMLRFFIYILLIPKWIYWMTRNLFFIDLWRNPFLYYNKYCFKYNESIDEKYLSEMSYLKRRNIARCNTENSKIDKDDSSCNDSNQILKTNKTNGLSDITDININEFNNNDNNNNNNNNNNNKNYFKDNDDIINETFNKDIINNNIEESNNISKKFIRSSNSLSSLDITEKSIRKNDSLEIPLRKSNSSSFFNPFNDENKSSIPMEKERNILRSSYMSLDEFFRNLDSSSDDQDSEDSYQKKFHNQKQKIKHSLYSTFSNFERKIIDRPFSSKLYCKIIYPMKIKMENIHKTFHYKKNKLCFILTVQINLQKLWWSNQNKIKFYKKKYFLLNRIPEDVNYYIDKMIAPCQCKGSQKYVHSYCLDEWRMRTSIEYGQQENCILCRQSYRKKDNNKWYTKLQNKTVQNTILYITIILMVTIGGYLMKYILNVTYKYLDIGIEYELFPDYNNSSLLHYKFNDLTVTQDNYNFQSTKSTMTIYPDTTIYTIPEDESIKVKIHKFLFSEIFLKSTGFLNGINYHIMAGMFFLGSIINTTILYDSIKMVVRHHFNTDLRFKPLLLLTIIYFWWIYCSAAFEDLLGMNEYSISQKIETILLMKNGWVAELIDSMLFLAKWTLRIITMELGIYFNGVCYLKELLTFNYSACLNKDQILNYDDKEECK